MNVNCELSQNDLLLLRDYKLIMPIRIDGKRNAMASNHAQCVPLLGPVSLSRQLLLSRY